ncbi:MAG: translocation/assembly module TamB domain-containing protein [bacterium]
MNLKGLLAHFKARWRRYLILIILLILISLSLFKVKKVIEIRSEKWIREYLNKNVKLNIDWDDWKLDLIDYNLNITGLRIKRARSEGAPFWILTEKIEMFINPFPLFKNKTIDIRSIEIQGMKGRLLIPGAKEFDDLKSLIMIMNEKNGKKKENEKWSVRIGQIALDGKDFVIDLPGQKANIAIGDFFLFVPHLDQKGLYPINFNFKDGEINWKGIYRFVQSGKLKGAFSNQGFNVESSHVGFPEEGELNWTGNIWKGTDGITFEGEYSGALYCDTLAQFLKPFRQMKGKVVSEGSVGGRWKQLKIEGELESSQFSWRWFDFSEVKGRFSYYKGMLEFKDMEGQWRDGYVDAESRIALHDHNASVNIHIDKVPSVSFIKDWSKIFPGIPPLCTGDMEWNITWPEHFMVSEGLLKMDIPFTESGKYPDKKFFLRSRFRSRRSLLYLDEIDLILRENLIQAEGQYDFINRQVNLDYICTIKEDDLIRKIWGFPFKGSGRITGDVTNTLIEPKFSGSLEGERVSLLNYQLGSIAMDYEYHRKRLDLLNIKGLLQEASMEGRGNVIFSDTSGPPVLEFFWSIDGLPLSEVTSVFSYKPDFPYQGTVSGDGNLKMVEGQISSNGSFNGKEIRIFGQPAMKINAFFDAGHDRISFSRINATREKGFIRGELCFEKGIGLSVKGDGSDWDLYTLQLGGERSLPIEGVLDFDVSGNPDDMTGSFKMQGMSFREKGNWDISGTINLKRDILLASVIHPWGEADCEMNLKGDLPFKIISGCDSLSVFDPQKGLIRTDKEYSLLFSGNLEIEGLLKKGLKSIEGSFQGRDLMFSGPQGKFENKEDYKLIIKDKEIFTPSLIMRWEKGELDFNGYWKLPTGLDFNVSGLIPLNVLQEKMPDMKGLNGKIELAINVKGTVSDPLLQGEINVSEGEFSMPRYNFRADNIRGNILLKGNSANIKSLTAEIRGNGLIELRGVVFFQGRDIESFDLAADFDNLYIYKKDAYKGFLEGQLEWTGRPDSGLLTGDVLIKEARHYDYRDIIQLLLAKKREVETDKLLEDESKKNLVNFFDRTNANIGLALGEGFWVRSPFYNATLTGNLLIKGTLSNPWLDGEIEAKEGEIIIGSQRFSLASGKIKLMNPELSEPTINALALKDINSYRLRLSVFGPLNKPNLQFSSTPYLSQPEILNMVFFGLTTEDARWGEEQGGIISLMLSTTSSVLSGILGDEISHYTGLDMMRLNYLPQDLFRLDILNVELKDEGGEVERLTVGKTLSKRLKIKYSHLKGEEQREIAEAEYMITDHLTLIGAQDDQGDYSLDLNIGFPF